AGPGHPEQLLNQAVNPHRRHEDAAYPAREATVDGPVDEGQGEYVKVVAAQGRKCEKESIEQGRRKRLEPPYEPDVEHSRHLRLVFAAQYFDGATRIPLPIPLPHVPSVARVDKDIVSGRLII